MTELLSPPATRSIPFGAAVHERARRRRTLFSIAAFIAFLITGPIFGHHFAASLSTLLLGQDHFLNLCVVALHQLLAPVHQGFHILLVVGVLYATGDRLRAVWRLRTALTMLTWHPPPPTSEVWRAAALSRVDPEFIRMTTGSGTAGFTAGLFNPRIFIATEMVARLSLDQLAAVLAHEDAHRRRRDPLRLSLWRFVSCTFFFVPIFARLASDLAAEIEEAADDAAVTQAAIAPVTLASALVAIAGMFTLQPRWNSLPRFDGSDMLARRVRRLLGEDVPFSMHVMSRSSLIAMPALVAVWFSGIVMAHPLPGAGHHDRGAHHCTHARQGPLDHLFCRHSAPSQHAGNSRGVCPHAT